MQRGCFLMRVKTDNMDEYKKAHEAVWPEMLDAIREAGIRNYSLFMHEDGLIVGYLEAEDVKESLRRVGETDANARWQAHMAPFFESGSGDLEKGALEWLDVYFHTA